MKTKRFFIATLLVVAATSVAVVSCKKETQNASQKQNNAPNGTEQNMSLAEQRVLNFLDAFDAMKRGEKAEGEPVSIADACQLMETTLNYCHGYTHEQISSLRHDTIRMALPKGDAQGNITQTEMLETYETLRNAVRDAYVSIEMEDKALMFVMLNLDGNAAKDGNKNVEIVLTVGRHDIGTPQQPTPYPWYGVPFNNSECYNWAEFAGVLTEKVAQYDLRNMAVYNPCPTCYTFIENPHTEFIYVGGQNNDCMFYECGLTYDEVENYQICWPLTQEIYACIMETTHYEGMLINPYGYEWYYYTEVWPYPQPNPEDNTFCITYYYIVMNATRWWRNNNGVYPIPIDE